jgi:hypothetical protein
MVRCKESHANVHTTGYRAVFTINSSLCVVCRRGRTNSSLLCETRLCLPVHFVHQSYWCASCASPYMQRFFGSGLIAWRLTTQYFSVVLPGVKSQCNTQSAMQPASSIFRTLSWKVLVLVILASFDFQAGYQRLVLRAATPALATVPKWCTRWTCLTEWFDMKILTMDSF